MFLAKVKKHSENVVAPYKKIMTSIPFWALAVLHFANLWGLFIMMMSIPKFNAEVLGFDLKKAGAVSALPPLLRLFTGLLFGTMGDAMKGKFRANILRKSYVLFSHGLPGLCIFFVTFVECEWLYATILLIVNQGFNAAVVITTLSNPQDLAPNFAGTIFGVIAFVGGFGQFLVPTITGLFTQHGSTMEQWQYVFYIGTFMYWFGAVFFIIFGSAERQSWNEQQVPE